MPRRYYNKKRSFKRRRSYSRKRRTVRHKNFNSNRQNVAVVRGPAFMPDKLLVNHTYTYRGVIPFVASERGGIVFSGNGMYRPYAADPISVLGFSNMTSNYALYQVHASKFTCTFDNEEAESVVVTLVPCETIPTGTLGAEDTAALPYAKTRYLSKDGDTGDRTTMSHYMTTKKMFGEKLTSTNFKGTAIANPSYEWLWVIQGQYLTSKSTNLLVYVEIKYWCEWMRRENIDLRP